MAHPNVSPGTRIDIWSDVVCQFCTLGKRHLELALANFDHADEVEIVWHSFELDPNELREPGNSLLDKMSEGYGMSREQAQAGLGGGASGRRRRPRLQLA